MDINIEMYGESLVNYCELVCEAKEGRYDLTGYDLHVIEAALTQYLDTCVGETSQRANKDLTGSLLLLPSALRIKLHEYAYHCGDGCCLNYGTVTTVNDVELPCHNQDSGTILSEVLKHLGFSVEIEYSEDTE